MRSFSVIFAIGANLAVADVPCHGYSVLSTFPVLGGQHVIYEGSLWRANWHVETPPSSSNIGWTKLGVCDEPVPTPPCTAPDWQPIIYENPTTVTWNGAHWANRWWAGPSPYPSADNLNNWYKLFDCDGHGEGPVTPTEAPIGTPVATTAVVPVTTATTIPTNPPVLPTNPPVIPTNPPVLPTNPPIIPTNPPVLPTNPPIIPTNPPVIPTNPPVVPTNPPVVPTTPSTPSVTWNGGPVGPNGECIWPAWTSRSYDGGEFVTVGQQVYSPAYWVGAGTAPPTSPWAVVATCVGDVPKSQWTLNEIIAQINANGPEYQSIRDPTSFLTQMQDAGLAEREAELRNSSPAAASVISATRVLPVELVEAIVPNRDANPDNVKRVERLMSEDDFEMLFPLRFNSYTYTGLLRAIGAFPAYCGTYTDGRNSDDICKRMLAVSFAHFTQEVGANWPDFTYGNPSHDSARRNPGADKFYAVGEVIPRWKQALWFVREQHRTEEVFGNEYRQCSIEAYNRIWGLNAQCVENTDYFGRGSKQLSWNYNYGGFSQTMFDDSYYLLSNPALVADTWLNFASAVWFAITPQNPKPAMLHVIDGTFVPNSVDIANGMTNGFAATIDIINGALECRGANKVAIANRIEFYKGFMDHFGLSIDADERLDCDGLPGFTAGSAGAVLTYLDKGNNHSCNLVTWQTPWKITVNGDYERCVHYYYSTHWVSKSTKRVVASYGGDSIY